MIVNFGLVHLFFLLNPISKWNSKDEKYEKCEEKMTTLSLHCWFLNCLDASEQNLNKWWWWWRKTICEDIAMLFRFFFFLHFVSCCSTSCLNLFGIPFFRALPIKRFDNNNWFSLVDWFAFKNVLIIIIEQNYGLLEFFALDGRPTDFVFSIHSLFVHSSLSSKKIDCHRWLATVQFTFLLTKSNPWQIWILTTE